jgi:hypothetical protein
MHQSDHVEGKWAAMAEAATRIDFFNVRDVIELTEGLVDWSNEEQSWVVKENGATKQNDQGHAMSLYEFYTWWASQHRYMVRSVAKPGADKSA